jgi:lipoprotein NlpI
MGVHDLDGALADCNRAIELDPKFAKAYFWRGIVKSRKGDFADAVADFNRALELDKNAGSPCFYRGCVYFMEHRWAEAMADYRTSCELKMHDLDYPHLFIWLVRARIGEKEAAIKELAAYLEKRVNKPGKDWPVKVANFLLDRISEDDLAVAAVSTDAKKDRGQHCETWFYAGMKRLLAGDETAAADCFRKSLATEAKDYTEYYFARAELKALQ